MSKLYDVTIGLDMNGKKIEAIKEIRRVFGLGLAKSKAFVEHCDFVNGSFSTPNPIVRVTAEQLAAFAAIAMRPVDLASETTGPRYWLNNVVEVSNPGLYDDFTQAPEVGWPTA